MKCKNVLALVLFIWVACSSLVGYGRDDVIMYGSEKTTADEGADEYFLTEAFIRDSIKKCETRGSNSAAMVLAGSDNSRAEDLFVEGLLKVQEKLIEAKWHIISRLNNAPSVEAQEKHLEDMEALESIRREMHGLFVRYSGLDCCDAGELKDFSIDAQALVSHGLAFAVSYIKSVETKDTAKRMLYSGVASMLELANSPYTFMLVGYVKPITFLGIDEETAQVMENFILFGKIQ